jgi:hypothetical protein
MNAIICKWIQNETGGNNISLKNVVTPVLSPTNRYVKNHLPKTYCETSFNGIKLNLPAEYAAQLIPRIKAIVQPQQLTQ